MENTTREHAIFECTNPGIGEYNLGSYKYQLLDAVEQKDFAAHVRACGYCAQAVQSLVPCTDLTMGQRLDEYLWDILSDAERDRFEAHAVTCPGCLQALHEDVETQLLLKLDGAEKRPGPFHRRRAARYRSELAKFDRARAWHHPCRAAFCHDPDTGEMVTEYRFGLLSKRARRRFEAHVLLCAYCAQVLRQGPHCVDPALGKRIVDYACGALQGRRRARFEAHLERCAHCAIEVLAYAQIVHAVTEAGEPLCECASEAIPVREQLSCPECAVRVRLFRFRNELRRSQAVTRQN